MIDNATLAAIRNRRSIRNFTPEPITDDQITAVLEAGRWAPSARNSQPWDFVVVRDQKIRSGLGSILKQVTFSWGGLSAAPVMIIVSVDQTADSVHFIEDGAVIVSTRGREGGDSDCRARSICCRRRRVSCDLSCP